MRRHLALSPRGLCALAAVVALLLACRPQSDPAGPHRALLASRDGIGATEGLASPEWQGTVTALVAQGHVNPLAASRAYALVGVAQYRAVRGAERGSRGGAGEAVALDAESGRRGGSSGAHDRGAVAGASVVVLSYLFPAQAQALEDMVTAQRDAGPEGWQRAFAAGEAIGRAVGATIVTRAQGDGFTKPFTGTIPVGPGLWISNTTPPTVAGGQMPGVLPWFLTSASQFRPAPPPAFGSAAFLAALAEIRQISDTRTAEQIQIAIFWAMNAAAVNPGEPTPPGYWMQVATDGINAHALSEREATHLYALLSTTMFDAAIACWDGKLTYWFIRPWQADPGITIVPAVGKPNHPSYPSAHSSFSSSAAEVLSAFFPEQRAQLDALVTEAGLSRMYGGIHYRFDIEAGRQLGRSVAQFTLAADRSGHSVLTPDDE
jgi:membrane-associated phospholipid phosphatase